jgi:methyl-accepting chemotaxis protein
VRSLVFFGVFDMAVFSRKFIDPIKVGDSGYAYVYNDAGTVLAHPDKSKILDLNINDF